ncbi:MAG: hypothetical protein HY951_10955 [Bacteroidia bacterium]|nr:hypothetical protein [Bacteroidia bacterium]
MRNIIVIIVMGLFFTGCVGEWDRKLDEKQISTEIFGTTSTFSTKNVRLKVNEYDNILTITIDYKLPKNFSFPVDSFYGDTLTETRFYLRLLCDGKPITLNRNVLGYRGFYDSASDTSVLIIPFKKQLIYPTYHDEVKFSMAVFHMLKAGNHKIDGELFITKFYGSHYDKETKETTELEVDNNDISGKVNFKIKVPEIYLTTIYGNGLELRNDDKFSPRGMDFSFREGYPDIYWEIFYPAYGESDFTFPYWRSKEATYATGYSDKDTIYLYHFSNNEEFKIGVYDRDDLSGDDYLGDWFGTIKDIESNTYKRLKFDNLQWLEIKAKQQGCINK